MISTIFLSLSSDIYPISEGKDAKYHYMVCGVQGDFTRGLVTDMPTHIWTREVKVRPYMLLIRTSLIYLFYKSSLVWVTHRRFTVAGFGSVLVLELELLFLRVCNQINGS